MAQAPSEAELSQAEKWLILLPTNSIGGLSELFLQVSYQGDVARLYSAHRLLTDNFYNGQPWSIGLRRYLDPQGSGKFDLSILPLRKDAPIYLESADHLDFSHNGQACGLESVGLVPEYELVINADGR